VVTKLLSLTAGLILGAAGLASANRSQPTKFTIRIENITKPDAFTASNGVKWSLAFSPGLAVVHNRQSADFHCREKGSWPRPRSAIGGRESGHAGQVTGRGQGNKVCRRF